MDHTLKEYIKTIIRDNWDSFCEQGASRPTFDFEFCIDTGNFFFTLNLCVAASLRMEFMNA